MQDLGGVTTSTDSTIIGNPKYEHSGDYWVLPGETPITPIVLSAAAIVPATCVPLLM